MLIITFAYYFVKHSDKQRGKINILLPTASFGARSIFLEKSFVPYYSTLAFLKHEKGGIEGSGRLIMNAECRGIAVFSVRYGDII